MSFGSLARRFACAIAASCFMASGSATAFETRDAAFQAMLASPTNSAAMLAYARFAVADRDYEAVASTLQRVLDLDPNNGGARFELAVAYFALGSYELSKHHFLKLQRTPAIESYLAQIEERTAKSNFSGHFALGGVSTDKGTAGRVDARLRWSLDMGGRNDNRWITDFNGDLYSGSADLSTSRLRLRTGPMFSLDGNAFGARLRPYVEASRVNDPDGDEFTTTSFGIQYFNAHGASLSSFADLRYGKYRGSGTLSDGEMTNATLGLSYTPSRGTRLRFSLFGSRRNADVATDSTQSWGARLGIHRSFAPLFGGQGRNWIGSAYVQQSTVDYTNTTREDKLTSAGLSVRAFLKNDFYVETGLQGIRRTSTTAGLDDQTPFFSILVGKEF